MNFPLLKYISSRISKGSKSHRFLSFARVVALISVTLGSMALILALSVLDGYMHTFEETAVKFSSHIIIKSFKEQHIKNYPKIISILNNYREIKSAIPVIQREGLISSKSFVEGVVIRTINRQYDQTNIAERIKSGKFDFESDSSKQIIISNRLSQRLGINISDSVVIYAMKKDSPSSDNYPDIDKFQVSAIYETGMVQYDDIVVFIPFSTAKKLFHLEENMASEVNVMLKDSDKLLAVQKELEEKLPFPDNYCYNYIDLNQAVFSWIELQKAPIPIVLGLITVVAVFNILTILLITVVEKTHSIGILRTLGVNNKEIMQIFVLQGTVLGITGTLLGCFIALIMCLVQKTWGLITLPGEIYFLEKLPISISLWHYAIVIFSSVFISFLATLIPSRIATKITPIRAIRFK